MKAQWPSRDSGHKGIPRQVGGHFRFGLDELTGYFLKLINDLVFRVKLCFSFGLSNSVKLHILNGDYQSLCILRILLRWLVMAVPRKYRPTGVILRSQHRICLNPLIL